MAKSTISEAELVAALKSACEKAGGQSAWAAAAGLSPAYVSDVLVKRRSPGRSICKALGYERAPATYRKKDIWEENNR